MPSLPVRSATELDTMRAAGRVVARTLLAVRAAAVPGVRLRELDELAQTTIREAGALPSFLGYLPTWAPTPFNGALCLSPNEVVVHGRPTGRRLVEGDHTERCGRRHREVHDARGPREVDLLRGVRGDRPRDASR